MSVKDRTSLVPPPPDTLAYESWGDGHAGEKHSARLEVWNPNTLAWEKMTQPTIDAPGSVLDVDLQGVEALLTSVRDRLPATLDGANLRVVLEASNAVVAVSGPLTDTQLRATPVPVSGTVTTGGLTDTQLRATPVAVSTASLPLPAGAATEATLLGIKTGTDKIPASPAATADVQAVRDRLPAALDADGGAKTHVQNWPATQSVSGSIALTGSDGIISASPTVRAYNGGNCLYTRDPAVLNTLSQMTGLLAQLLEHAREDD